MLRGIVLFCYDNFIAILMGIWLGWSTGNTVVMNMKIDRQEKSIFMQSQLIRTLYLMQGIDIQEMMKPSPMLTDSIKC